MNNQKRRMVTLALFIATFLSAVEGTIVATAMPTIVGDLNGLSMMNWVFSIYLLMGAVSTPIYGKLADRIGRKPIMMTGVILFILGSFCCSLAPSMPVLIMARFLQGIGSGAILPISMTIIADIYPVEKRANIIGVNNMAWGIASIIAPLIGGILVEYVSWHWVFLINVPVGFIVLLLLWHFYDDQYTPSTQKVSMDMAGTVFLTIFLISLLYVFQLVEKGSIFAIVITAIISLGALVLFINVEQKAKDSIMPLSLFKRKDFIFVNIVSFLLSGVLIGLDAYTPMWLQLLNGTSASVSGMALASMSIVWMLGSFIAGRLLQKYSIANVLSLSMTFFVIAAICWTFYPIYTPYIIFVLVGCILGLGFGLSITTATIAAQEMAPRDMIGVASSTNTLFRTIGQSMMVGIYGTLLNHHMVNTMKKYNHISHKELDQFMNAQTSTKIPNAHLEALRDIIYSGLHQINLTMVYLVLMSVIMVYLLHRIKKSNR